MCDLGWPSLRIPEDRGGVGLDMEDYCALTEMLGAALAPEPLIAAVLAASLLDGAALAAQLSGERLILPAWQEARDTVTPGDLTELCQGRLDGRKIHIGGAAGADGFVVMTPQGCALVDADADGVELQTLNTQDGGHYGALLLRQAQGQPLAGDASSALAEATLATAAYLLGLIDQALERTVDYMKTRVQFGQAIASFQALQHRAVDLKLQASLSRASISDAARQWDAAPTTPASLAAISRAKARASATAMLVTRAAIQIHGGIGYTDEHDIGLYLRKAMTLAPAYGGAALHRGRYAQLVPDRGYAE